MPMIDLTYVCGSLDEQALGRLTDELVTALLRAERAPDTPFLRGNTLVYLHTLDPAAYSGHPVSAAIAVEAMRIYLEMDLPKVATTLGDASR